eukprot:CAMPEP_0113849658 /NCGR_PEP_ID=MMETSP0372-20130328/3293_1 /TAXON_ID=340204 /ORGANISM="Lankesteria abbotti" /LENGTH=110 /DNA_ID=CAMNT_0000819553 /DNA_START=43 /DNA_END=375 /DNA_ORIENTATION=+ /assembly_acc=CAM_ASM_000359
MSMKYVAAYMMAVLGGNEAPSKGDVEKILGAVGSDIDQTLLTKFLATVNGKATHELVASGMTKLQSVPSGGAVVASGAVTTAAAAPAAEEKPQEPEEESEEEDMGFSLFD